MPTNLYYDSDMFSCNIEGKTAIVTLKSEAFKVSQDVSGMTQFINVMGKVETDDNIKGVLVLDLSNYQGTKHLQTFLEALNKETHAYQKEKTVSRYTNAVKSVTMGINTFSKPIIVAIDEQAPIDVFGYYLACDYIIATDNLQIEFPANLQGVIPSSAVSFFVKKNIGTRRTFDIFMSGKSLSAAEALSLNIVNEVVSKETIKTRGLEKLEEFYRVPEVMRELMKKYLKDNNHEIEAHFDDANRVMWSSLIH
jgi:enoyl-CoA hydratase/carnithine racemase